MLKKSFKFYMIFLLKSALLLAQNENSYHCGFDFTSYLVVETYFENKLKTPDFLKVEIIDSKGEPVLNTNYFYSYQNSDKFLFFSKNYIILPINEVKVEKWYFPYAKESFFIMLKSDFPYEEFKVKVSDKNQVYKSLEATIFSENLFKLCAQNENTGKQFGPKSNIPIKIFLEKVN